MADVHGPAAELADDPDDRERGEEQGRATQAESGDGLQARSHVGQTPRPGAL